MQTLKTCRFCRQWRGDMIKYGARHHAHFECGFAKKGMRFARDIVAHPGLSWKLQDYTIAQIVAALPERERTVASIDELRQLLGRSE